MTGAVDGFEPYDWAVVGGGRWGRVLAEQSLKVIPERCGIRFVTRNNVAAVKKWLSGVPELDSRRVAVTEDFVGMLADHKVSAVIVANRPGDHAGTAERVLAVGKHAFVEKPFTLRSESAEALVRRAVESKLVLVVGLEYLFASYLSHLRAVIGERTVQSLSFEWADPVNEYRHGGHKQSDPGISVFQDVFPHIWSILRVLLPKQKWAVGTATLDYDDAYFELTGAAIHLSATLSRGAEHRIRVVRLKLAGGTTVALDFSDEPGRLAIDEKQIDGCPRWATEPRPVFSELKAFQSAIEDGVIPWHAGAECLDSVRLAEAVERHAASGR